MLEGPWGPIELWEAFGPTYPCIPRERIGDVLDGGKWCALGLPLSLRSGECGAASAADTGRLPAERAGCISVPPHR